jgi:hypothetical protein
MNCASPYALLGDSAPGQVNVFGSTTTQLCRADCGDRLSIVIQEILQGKIILDLSEQPRTLDPSAGDAIRRAMLSDVSD